MNIIKAYQTKNDCYKAAKTMVPKGIVVHSTGANNPKLSRYVDCPEELGKPASKNWNRAGVEKMVHAFIGYDKNNDIRVVNTLPYNYCCWGCGQGKKGSYNYSPAYIQFEICEDGLKDGVYFSAVMNTAIEYCVFLCKTYDLSVDNIVSHKGAHQKGYGSNHADCDHWLKNFGKDMDWFRAQVTEALNLDNNTDNLEYVPWIGRVNAGSVNRRVGPSADTKSLGTVHKGEEYKVIRENPVDNYGSIWVEMENMGWINKRYLDFIKYIEEATSVEDTTTTTNTNVDTEVSDDTEKDTTTDVVDNPKPDVIEKPIVEQPEEEVLSKETQLLIIKLFKSIIEFITGLFKKK